MNEKPRWHDEMMQTVTPSDDIICKTCLFRLADVEVAGTTIKRHTYGNCKIFETPEMKPDEVLWEGAECEYYEKE